MKEYNFYILRLRPYLLAFCFLFACHLNAQITVSGNVLSEEDKEPLIGVNILTTNSESGTITDFDGNFTINVGSNDTLVLSYVGFKSQKVPVNNRQNILITMASNAELMSEVVVIGYGKVRKSDLTGAVSSVKQEELTKIPSMNATQALQGKVSGLSVLNSSGAPGSEPVLRLRGITTLNNNNPIFVVDGVILNSIDFLNANDIESIEVLKDASATAIFGSRGSNGVVMVTTRSGKAGKMNVSFSADYGVESAARKIDVMSGQEFGAYYNGFTPGTFGNLDALPNVDWQDLVLQKNAPISNYNVSLSGANEKLNYYFGLGLFNQKGIIPKSDLQRITAKLNSTYTITPKLRLGTNISISIRDQLNPPGVTSTLLRAWPIDEPYLEDGVTFAEVNGSNPLAAIEYTNSNSKSLSTVSNIFLEYEVLPGLSVKTSYQYNFGGYKSKSFTPVYFVAPLQQNEENNLSVNYGNANQYIWENTINYSKDIGIHRIDAVAGYSVQEDKTESISSTTRNLIREGEDFWYINAGQADLSTTSNGASQHAIISYLARVNYSLNSKYLATATIRRDGSSNTGANQRFGYFPSFALGWNLSNEDWWTFSRVENVKLRASYGIIGNEKISPLDQYSLIGTYDAVFGTSTIIYPGLSNQGAGNPNLQWEETKQFDVGLNFDLYGGRLVSEIDYYIKNTEGILVNLTPPGHLGVGAFGTIRYNAADIENSGIDFSTQWRDNVGNNWSYSLGLVASTVNNKILNLGEDIGADSTIVAGDLGNGQRVSINRVGSEVGTFFGYQVIGVFQNQADLESNAVLFGQQVGDFKYLDANNDGVINSKDRVELGSSVPDLIYGFSASVGYKAFNLSVDLQGQYGSEIYNGKQAIRFAVLNFEDKYNNYWTGDGSTDEHHAPASGGTNFLPSSYFVEDGSYLRIRSATLTYDIPATLLGRIKLSTASLYVRATNLHTFTKFTGYSPDIGAGNVLDGSIDRGIYPITRAYNVGLKLNF